MASDYDFSITWFFSFKKRFTILSFSNLTNLFKMSMSNTSTKKTLSPASHRALKSIGGLHSKPIARPGVIRKKQVFDLTNPENEKIVVPPVLPNCFQSNVIGSLHSKYPCSKQLVIYSRLCGSEEPIVQDQVRAVHDKVMSDLEKVKSEIKALEEKQLALQCDAQLTTALQCHFESNSAELAHLGKNWCAKFEETPRSEQLEFHTKIFQFEMPCDNDNKNRWSTFVEKFAPIARHMEHLMILLNTLENRDRIYPNTDVILDKAMQFVDTAIWFQKVERYLNDLLVALEVPSPTAVSNLVLE